MFDNVFSPRAYIVFHEFVSYFSDAIPSSSDWATLSKKKLVILNTINDLFKGSKLVLYYLNQFGGVGTF